MVCFSHHIQRNVHNLQSDIVRFTIAFISIVTFKQINSKKTKHLKLRNDGVLLNYGIGHFMSIDDGRMHFYGDAYDTKVLESTMHCS